MFRLAVLLGLAGLAVATTVLAWSGFREVFQALMQSGWGILAVAAFHAVPLVIASAGWRVLVPGKQRSTLPLFVYFMWIRTAVNDFLPVARVGGEIASVRVMMAHRVRKDIAIATTVVELTLSTAAILLFVIGGVILFAVRVNDRDVVAQMAWGVVLSMPLLGLLILVQKIGFFGLLSRMFRAAFRDKWLSFAGDAARLDRAVAAIYRRRKRAIVCFLAQLAAWVIGSFEIWISLVFLGHPLSIIECVMIEALIQGAVSAAFAVPGALGIQEAGFVVFGGMLGLPHEIAAALSLMRRCRDVIYNTPALIAWQVHEGRKLLKK